MKKTVSVILALLILFSCFSFIVFAVEPAVILSSETASPGEKVTVTVTVKNNPGINSMYLDIRYDSNLILESVVDTELFGGALFSERISSYPYCLSWDETMSSEDNKKNGVIAQLNFIVPEETPEGTYPITVSYNKEETYNKDFNNIDFEIKDGAITVAREGTFTDNEHAKLYNEYIIFSPGAKVSDVLAGASAGSKILNEDIVQDDSSALVGGYTLVFPNEVSLTCVCIGDLDGSTGITAGDARMALRAAVDLERLEPWQVLSADADNSGMVTASDARLILRASVGLENSSDWHNAFSYETLVFDRFQGYENDYISNETDFTAAGKYIANKVKNLESFADIYQFRIRKEDAELLIGEYIFYVPEFFYVGTSVGIETEDGYLKKLSFTYSNTAKRDIEIYREEISRLINLSDKSWSDLEIALFYHDYICSAYKYDTKLKIYDAFNLITKKEGVCQANSLLYVELLNMCGVPAKFVSSKEMVHAWNVVKIGEEWYHVDITWDDPVNDRYGLASHEYFLLSDSEMSANKHYGWMTFSEDIYCTDTGYDNYFWQQSESPFTWLNGNWYYIKPDASGFSVYKTDLKYIGTEVISLQGQWKVGFSSYDEVYSGLGVFNNQLVFNTSDKIISFDVNTGNSRVLFSEDNSYRCVFGMFAGDKIYYHLSSSPDPLRQNISTLNIMSFGDVNCDGAINAKDYTVLLRYVERQDLECDLTVADFDSSGQIDREDADLLRYHIINKI